MGWGQCFDPDPVGSAGTYDVTADADGYEEATETARRILALREEHRSAITARRSRRSGVLASCSS
jgi:hypothetical protein